ncbi:hypothetical protein GGX14DRAFT_615808, partial [Mycena pura]
DGEEQCLEWHEVIELKAFSERKAWIEDKIKFLEQLPSVEVFVGLDAIRASAEEVPGLPTRQDLEQWLVEHDTIEKETEIFDTGELQTIRKFTKAATQRNLSPADTDLIELTLTTIYDLDKLLHLLRDRSENFELLGYRISWEEFRTAAWIDRRTIIADLKKFLDTRVRWTPAVYEDALPTTGTPPTSAPPSGSTTKRRASLTSLASLASVASDTLLSSAGFSRSVRFKLAEVLSRDAAQFSARITSLRHNRISAAGKMLDKLIDSSRKPVPEDLLDEQDRLEEKGIVELENVGKFVMNAVMQWRKADEIYVESMKDQVTAQTLWDEIEAAKFQHPTARQSVSFVTRAEALIKRLALRGDPASPTSLFPRPTHVLFPEHQAVNECVAQTLSSEVANALELARKVETSAREYRLNYEAVNRVETLVETASTSATTFTMVIEQLEKGVSSTDGDGTPPNLMSEACLEPTHHAAFLALLPSILKRQEAANESAGQVLRSSRGALLALDRPGIDPAFKSRATAEFQRLSTLRGQAQWTRDDVKTRVARLREARRIWALMNSNLSQLEEIRRDTGEAMEKHRWQQEIAVDALPPTPDSFSTPLPADSPPTESTKWLDELSTKLEQEIDIPLSALSKTLETLLKERLLRSSAGLKQFLEQVRQMVNLLQSIQNQSIAMGVIRDEFNGLQMCLDDLKMRVGSGIEEVLASRLVESELSNFGTELAMDIEKAQTEVKAFTDSLPVRVPFISREPRLSPTVTPFVKRRFSSVDLTLVAFDKLQSVELPFDLQSLDDAVRADSNSYAMKLGGEVQALNQRKAHFGLAQMTKGVDTALSAVVADINQVVHQFASLKTSLATILSQSDISQPLADFAKVVEGASQDRRASIARSFSPIRELLRQMEAAPGVHDAGVHESMYLTRLRAVDDAELKFQLWTDDAESLAKQVAHAQRAEAQRLESHRIEEEQRLRAERERIAAEEAERARIEQERLDEEARVRLEEERSAEEQRQLAERERAVAEEAERARLERQRLEIEAKLRLAEEQLAEQHRLQAEGARLAAKQAERERLEREAREKAERERTEEERRLQAEKDRIAAEEAENARFAAQKAEQERLKREHVFGLRATPSELGGFQTAEMNELQNRIFTLRKRLRAMSIEGLANPSVSATYLPGEDELGRVIRDFLLLSEEVATLPLSAVDLSVDIELNSLRTEIVKTTQFVERLKDLAKFSREIHVCEAALSDLLEHIDSYPSAPLTLASSFQIPPDLLPEDQLTSRLSFTSSVVESLVTLSALVEDDQRVIAERDRIRQTWSELEEMAKDRLQGRRSRPASVSSGPGSGRNSSASIRKSPTKMSTYSVLSISSVTAVPSQRVRSRLAPSESQNGSRRSTYGTERSRPASQLSNISSSRSTSGPVVRGSTFASRQRTTSLTPSTHGPPRRPLATNSRRTVSPSVSGASSYSRSILSPSRSSSASTSTWSRTPKYSLASLPKAATPPKKAPPARKKYVANPKSKLDVAVGEVVNKLPVGISIEGVSDNWKDQSGKYWIGDQDPKLCFCRILRSQTVMVRVGGGWQELSKFIKGHFADSFRLLSESPHQVGGLEPKWISSATLVEAVEPETPPHSPRTPEPDGSALPSISLQTPNGNSPRSLKSSPSTKGSPLTALQFMRRAEPEATSLQSVSPSKSTSHIRTRTASSTPARNSVWRP